jgi:cytidylate kinase
MSGGEMVASCLSNALDYPLVGRDVLVAAAAKLDIPEEILTQKIVRSPGLWDRMTSDLRIYIVAVQAALAEHIIGGNLVYHGHAGHLLLRDIPNVFRVRLIAPLEMRIRVVMEKQRLEREAAAEYIHHIDEERLRWTKFIYGVDWGDPGLYDMVLNLEKMSVETACQMIVSVVDQPEFATTAAVKKVLKDFLLVCRVKLALMINIQTRPIEFEVTAEEETVKIQGKLPRAQMIGRTSERVEAEVLRAAQSVEGVKTVQLNLQKFDAYN